MFLQFIVAFVLKCLFIVLQHFSAKYTLETVPASIV